MLSTPNCQNISVETTRVVPPVSILHTALQGLPTGGDVCIGLVPGDLDPLLPVGTVWVIADIAGGPIVAVPVPVSPRPGRFGDGIWLDGTALHVNGAVHVLTEGVAAEFVARYDRVALLLRQLQYAISRECVAVHGPSAVPLANMRALAPHV